VWNIFWVYISKIVIFIILINYFYYCLELCFQFLCISFYSNRYSRQETVKMLEKPRKRWTYFINIHQQNILLHSICLLSYQIIRLKLARKIETFSLNCLFHLPAYWKSLSIFQYIEWENRFWGFSGMRIYPNLLSIYIIQLYLNGNRLMNH
jgi:hypothetical protein